MGQHLLQGSTQALKGFPQTLLKDPSNAFLEKYPFIYPSKRVVHREPWLSMQGTLKGFMKNLHQGR